MLNPYKIISQQEILVQKKMNNILKIILAILLLISTNALALSPEVRLENEKLEARAMELFLEVKCLTCNGQVIENSESEFAFQMRNLIRQKISAGKSNEEIKNELSAEFGEDILTSSKDNKLGAIALFLIILAALAIFIFIKKS